MILVYLESPYAGDRERNRRYLHAAMRDCLARGEAPFASHEMYTGALDDDDSQQRELGMCAGFAWAQHAAKTVVNTDLGISSGMARGVRVAQDCGRAVEYRTLPDWPEEEVPRASDR